MCPFLFIQASCLHTKLRLLVCCASCISSVTCWIGHIFVLWSAFLSYLIFYPLVFFFIGSGERFRRSLFYLTLCSPLFFFIEERVSTCIWFARAFIDFVNLQYVNISFHLAELVSIQTNKYNNNMGYLLFCPLNLYIL